MSGITKPRESFSRAYEILRMERDGSSNTAKKQKSPQAPWSPRVIPGQELCLVCILGRVLLFS